MAGVQGTLLICKRMDQSFGAECLAVISRWLVFRGPE